MFPLHVSASHWTLLAVFPKLRLSTGEMPAVYVDSLNGSIATDDVSDAIQFIIFVQLHLFHREIGVRTHIKKVKTEHRQSGGVTCGLHVLSYARAFAARTDIGVPPAQIENFRLQVANEIIAGELM